MHISLDCYQLLGLPIQATPEQLEQAYQDRQQQQPLHHYSTTTLAARQQLITQAYQTLRNPITRSQYDQALASYNQTLKTQTQPEDSPPGLHVEEVQLSGALLLLYELGAYTQAMELGQQHLSGGIFNLRRPYTGSALTESDILLTVALSYLELGREQWQQGHYEPAAYYLQGGLDVLASENQFSDVQSQLKTELYRLRPYRILELVSHPDLDSSERQRGLMLLKDMLLERQGIDGSRDDHSGLGIDDFLKFIQQLRAYLTTAEQQELFEAEARRPSAVGTYLASYALLARGVSQHQPALIRRAKSLLKRLLPHQDVYLEMASAALLLGQTQEALQMLHNTQDTDALAFIQEYSLNSPDWLPGLYHYTSQWLESEVYPAFRDLIGQSVGLEAYFADDQIQAYADALTAETTTPESPPVAVAPLVLTELTSQSGSSSPTSSPQEYSWPSLPTFTQTPLATPTSPAPVAPIATSATPTPATSATPTPATPAAPTPPWLPSLTAPTAPYDGIPDLPASLTAPRPDPEHPAPPPPPGPGESLSRNGAADPTPASSDHPLPPRPRTRLRIAHPIRFASVCSVLVLGMVGLGLAVRALWFNTSPDPAWSNATSPEPVEPIQPSPLLTPVNPDPGLVAPVTPASSPPVNSDHSILTTEMAQARIALWQNIKASALGQDYRVESLSKILAEPALSRWQSTAQTSQFEKSYWQFQLESIEVESLRPLGTDRFEVMARIREAAKFYQNNQLQANQSYEDDYRVRYVFIQQGNEWFIREMKVIS